MGSVDDGAVIYVLQRLVQGSLVMLGAATIVFALTFLSGDPAATLAPLDTTPQELELFRQHMGLDRPVPVQYVDFLSRAVQGDFGESYRQRQPAMGLVLERFPNTLKVAIAAILFALLVSIPLGTLSAMFHDHWIDLVARFVALVAQSVPGFLLGVVLILVFAVELRWLPSSGSAGPQSVVLPAVTIGSFSAGMLTRLLRSSLLEVLSQDFVRTAYAKGLRGRSVLIGHALKNAALPFTTMLGIQAGFLLSAAVVVETIFAYPGMGRLAVDAIAGKDVPVIQAFVIVAAAIVVTVNLLVDLVYTRLDPRIRLS